MKRTAPYAFVLMALSAVALASVVANCAWALAHREQAMRDEEARSTRLVTYLLRPGDAIRVPVDGGTDVIRVVAHAFRRGSLGATGHLARWRVAGSALETIAPGSTARASAEELGVAVGDPVAFNLDARESAPELWLGLDAISDADGMLIRVYRREATLGADQIRGDTLSFTKREHLAARAGELDWIDLPADERAMLIGARWGKVAPLPAPGHPLEAVAISLAPPAVRSSDPLAAAGSVVRRPLSALARQAQRLQLASTVQYDRVVPGRPAIVQALDEAIVLRVQVRQPLSGLEPKSVPLSMLVDITEASRTVTAKVDVDVRAPSLDIYEAAADGEVPSESTTFYALIPARGRAALRATVAPLDVVLAELDPQASERRFVARRPSNWQVFEAREHGVLRLAHRAPPVAKPRPTRAPLMRVVRPYAVAVTKSHGLSFIPASTAIPFESHAGSQTFSVRLRAEHPVDVRVQIDGGQPRRRKAGLAGSVTTARVVHVNGESRISLAVGDDLEPGRHTLSFQSSEAACWIHLPWVKRARAEPETTWVSGELDP